MQYTKVKLEVITDIDMYLMIEKGIQGGVSMITHNYDNYVNNGSDYKQDGPTSYIIYWDANNSTDGRKCLPTGGFHWVSDDELSTLDVRDIAEDADKRYILERTSVETCHVMIGLTLATIQHIICVILIRIRKCWAK